MSVICDCQYVMPTHPIHGMCCCWCNLRYFYKTKKFFRNLVSILLDYSFGKVLILTIEHISIVFIIILIIAAIYLEKVYRTPWCSSTILSILQTGTLSLREMKQSAQMQAAREQWAPGMHELRAGALTPFWVSPCTVSSCLAHPWGSGDRPALGPLQVLFSPPGFLLFLPPASCPSFRPLPHACYY